MSLKPTSSTTACTASGLIAGDASLFSSMLSVAADARTLGFWLGPTEIFDTQWSLEPELEPEHSAVSILRRW